MAAISRVVSVDYNGKRVLSLLNSTDSFLDVIQKFATDVSLYSVSCSTNGSEWTLLTTDIVPLPVIQVMDSFSFKFIRIDQKVPEAPAVQPDVSTNADAERNAFQLLMSPRKRRLPNKKASR